MVVSQLEKARGQTVSNITCYMKEYGVSEREAFLGIQKMIKSLWKCLNKDFLRPRAVPRPVLKNILGMISIATELYTESNGDGFTESLGKTKEIITSLLRDPIPINFFH